MICLMQAPCQQPEKPPAQAPRRAESFRFKELGAPAARYGVRRKPLSSDGSVHMFHAET
jgi:hypothetical protein